MWIKKIELENVQRHKHLVLNLREGVNILSGKTGVGKTCIMRALQWILANDFSSDDIRKDETKKTVVSLTLDNDIIISRTKSESINRYEIKYPDKDEVVKHDDFGRTVPKEVADIFNMPIMDIDKEDVILNIQSQQDRHFLLHSKATFRSKVLNKLTGNDLLDRIIKSFNSDLLGLNKEERRLKEELESKTKEKEILESDFNTKETLYKKVLSQSNNLKIMKEELEEAELLMTDLTKTHEELSNINIGLDDIEIPTVVDFKAKIEDFIEIDKIYHNLLGNKELQDNLKKMESVVIPDVAEGLSKTIENLEIVARIGQTRDLLLVKNNEVAAKISGLKVKIKAKIEEYYIMAKNIPTIKCPKCGTGIKEFEIKEIKL